MKYKNLKINYSDLPTIEQEEELGMGQCRVDFHNPTLVSGILQETEVQEFLTDANISYEVQEWSDSGCNDSLTDLEVVVYILHALTHIYRGNEEIHLDAQYDHIIWLFHDLSHVEHDLDHGELFAGEGEEERAIIESIETLIEAEIPLPIHILIQTQEEFLKKFDWELDLSKYLPAKDYTNLEGFEVKL